MASFGLQTHKAVRKDLKKIRAEAAKKITHEAFPWIAHNPFIGIPLVGALKGYFKFIIHSRGVSYRVIYQVDKKRNIVFVIAVGAREKFYERLIRRLQ